MFDEIVSQPGIDAETHPAAIEIRARDIQLYRGNTRRRIKFLRNLTILLQRLAADVDHDRHIEIP